MELNLPLNSNDIEKILPHRHPFLLVDVITELTVGERVVGKKAVTASENFFAGHFPGHHIMPGVLILEAMAQTGAVALMSMPENHGKLVYFTGTERVRFKRKVVPGDTLVMEVELTKFKAPFGSASAVAKVDGQVAATAEILFAVIAPEA